MKRLLSAALVAAALLLANQGRAAPEAAHVFRGTWIATSGKAKLGGRWSAQAVAGSPDQVVGSWGMLDESGEIRMQGTWSARRSGHGWRGTWHADVAGGGAMSGTWAATPSSSGTFEDMLRAAHDHQLAGTWRAGASHGNWWLKGEE